MADGSLVAVHWPELIALPWGTRVRVAVTLASGACLYTFWRWWDRRQRRLQRQHLWRTAGKDLVVLHQFARAAVSPNLSPFALKLETFLRMAGIRYVVDVEKPLGRRAKCPWVKLHGEELSDTELILDHLLQQFPAALPGRQQLTDYQLAVGRALQVTLDEHLVLTVATRRFLLDRMRWLVPMMSSRYRPRFRRLGRLAVWRASSILTTIGWGHFSRDEVMWFMRRDLQAVSTLLGHKPYLFGDQVTEFDACVFGQLTQVITGVAPDVTEMVNEFPNLVSYFERIKEQYWPDWAQCIDRQTD